MVQGQQPAGNLWPEQQEAGRGVVVHGGSLLVVSLTREKNEWARALFAVTVSRETNKKARMLRALLYFLRQRLVFAFFPR